MKICLCLLRVFFGFFSEWFFYLNSLQVPSCACLRCQFEGESQSLLKRRKEYFKTRAQAVSFLPSTVSLPSIQDVCPIAKNFNEGGSDPSRWISNEHEMTGGSLLKFDKLVAKHIPNKEYAVKKLEKKHPNSSYSVHEMGKLVDSLNGVVGGRRYKVFSLFAKRRNDEGLDLSDVMASFSTVIHEIVEGFKKEENLKDDDRLQIVMSTERGVMSTPISSKIQKVKDFDVANFLVHAAAYFQSDKTIKISDRVIIELIHIKMGRDKDDIGIGFRNRFRILNLKDAVLKKHSSHSVVNNDGLCLPRAVILCLAKKGVLLEKISSLRDNTDFQHRFLFTKKVCSIQNLKRSVNGNQKKLAQWICLKCGVNENQAGGMKQIKLFEMKLGIRIKIFDGCNFMRLIYKGGVGNVPTIYLLRTEGEDEGSFHFDCIFDVRGFLGKWFCDYCDIVHTYKFSHRCSDVDDWCFTCNHRDCVKAGEFGERCDSCFRPFRSDSCKKRHLLKDSVCGYFKCFECGRYLNRKTVKWQGVSRRETYEEVMKRHANCSSRCSVCQQMISEDHACYMKKTVFKNFVKKVVYLDFETNFETGVHIPIFCHLKWVFRKEFPGGEEEIGEKSFGLDDDISNDVGGFLFSPFFKDTTVIAHNLRGFDGCFLIQYMTANSLKPTSIITNGTKVTYMVLQALNMRFVDSLNLIPLPLSGFSKAFGLDDMGKGFFPYLFVKKENFDYVGPFPEPYFYGVDEMSEKTRKEFFEWHEDQKNKIFCFEDEMRRYCRQDVEILFQGVETFRRLICEMTTARKRKKEHPDELSEFEYSDDENDEWCINENECPQFSKQTVVDVCKNELNAETRIRKRKSHYSDEKWAEEKKRVEEEPKFCDPIAYCTLASICHAIFKTMYLKKNTIAQTPSGGYFSFQYSNKSIEWLEFLCHSENRQIIHQLNSSSGEVRIGNFRVDGFEKKSKTIFEFNGCFFHGHPACIVDMDAMNPVLKKTYQALYDKTMRRCELLETRGYHVIVKWECEWEKERKSPEVMSFLSSLNISTAPLNPKDAFFGGRVECFKLIDEGEIKSLDVNSLYPSVLASKKFPVGHPSIIISNTGTDLSPYFGFIKCDILPPSDLLIPVLPLRSGGKLIFGLCRTCISDHYFGYCPHNNDERLLKGTWFSEELKLAVSKGYQVLKIHQVYHFSQQSSRLFAPFIRKFYKLKMKSSGIPRNVDLEDFIQKLKDVEKIDIHPSEFSDNPGVRFIAKIILNSFWGRFAMREVRPQFMFASTIKEVYDLISNENLEVKSVRPIRSNIVGCVYEMKHASLVDVTNDRNIFIAAVTTAWARITFYNYADKVSTRSETQMIYGDTDSFYINQQRPPFAQLTSGAFLGDLSDELMDGETITLMTAPSPKSYAYVTNKNKSCVKFKGFSLAFETGAAFSIGNLKDLVETFVQENADENGCVQFSQEKFSRNVVARKRDFFLSKHLENPQKASSFFDKEIGVSIFNPRKIKRTETWVITSQQEQKLFMFDYDKRIVLKDFSTIPFGYKIKKDI